MRTPDLHSLSAAAEASLKPVFENIDKTAERGTQRVLLAFRRHFVSEAMFSGSTGYAYGDRGREALDAVFADVLGTEIGLVRLGFVNGTHAIGTALFAALLPGQTLILATGEPYETLKSTIGLRESPGSLKEYGVTVQTVDLLPGGSPDLASIAERAKDSKAGCVFIQRSRGYSARRALSVSEIYEIYRVVKEVNPGVNVVVDNCYGEFAEEREPRADLLAGSLIKNPGGGIAPGGGYVVGREDLVERAAFRLTVPGIGGECGATFGLNRLLFQGFFLAPHVVAQSLKTAAFCAKMMELLGFETSPRSDGHRSDIVQMIELRDPETLLAFCRGIQRGAPVDSFAVPEPWDMPGYDSKVVMAAGAFIQGASIELSCDAPMRPPYRAFLQGGLTYESGKFGVLEGISEILKREAP